MKSSKLCTLLRYLNGCMTFQAYVISKNTCGKHFGIICAKTIDPNTIRMTKEIICMEMYNIEHVKKSKIVVKEFCLLYKTYQASLEHYIEVCIKVVIILFPPPTMTVFLLCLHKMRCDFTSASTLLQKRITAVVAKDIPC